MYIYQIHNIHILHEWGSVIPKAMNVALAHRVWGSTIPYLLSLGEGAVNLSQLANPALQFIIDTMYSIYIYIYVCLYIHNWWL